MIQPGAVIRIPSASGKTRKTVLVTRLCADVEGLHSVFFYGRRINRDAHAVRSSGWVTVRDEKMFSVMRRNLDELTLCEDGPILAEAARVMER